MEIKAMKCPNCDAPIPEGSNFCEFCGSRIIIDDGVKRSRHEEVYIDQAKLEEVRAKNVDREKWEKHRKYFFLISGIIYIGTAVGCCINSDSVFPGLSCLWFFIIIVGYFFFKHNDPNRVEQLKKEMDLQNKKKEQRYNDIKSGKIDYTDLTDKDLRMLTAKEKLRLKKSEELRNLYNDLNNCVIRNGKKYNRILEQIREMEEDLKEG